MLSVAATGRYAATISAHIIAPVAKTLGAAGSVDAARLAAPVLDVVGKLLKLGLH